MPRMHKAVVKVSYPKLIDGLEVIVEDKVSIELTDKELKRTQKHRVQKTDVDTGEVTFDEFETPLIQYGNIRTKVYDSLRERAFIATGKSVSSHKEAFKKFEIDLDIKVLMMHTIDFI